MKAFVLLLLVVLPSALHAQREIREVESLDSFTVRDDRAYILFRRIRPEGVTKFEPILLRIPNEEDLSHTEQLNNVQNVRTRHALVDGRPESVHLAEIVPGDYVLYGAAGSTGVPLFHVCMCLGTVGFSAPAGRITDMGYFMADFVHEISVIPELQEESGFGPSSYGMVLIIGATVRPVRDDSTIPEGLPGELIVPAEYHAVGRFFDPRAMLINRLAPVPGILEYEGGQVIDPQTAQPVPDIGL